MSICSSFCVYVLLVFNLLFDLNFLFFSLISTRNTKNLEKFQIIYLFLWIIIFLLHVIWFCFKIVMMTLNKLRYYFTYLINLILILLSIFLFVIAISYDFTLIINSEIKYLGYQAFLWFGFILYLFLAIFDHKKIKLQVRDGYLIEEEERMRLEEIDVDDVFRFLRFKI